MTLYRVRAHMRFTESSGLATQARDEMAKRSPVIIRPGEPPEEPPVNKVVDDGDRREYVGDLPLPDEADAADGYALLADALADSEPLPGETGPSRPSWVQRHTCHHEDPADTARGCTVDESAEGPA